MDDDKLLHLLSLLRSRIIQTNQYLLLFIFYSSFLLRSDSVYIIPSSVVPISVYSVLNLQLAATTTTTKICILLTNTLQSNRLFYKIIPIVFVWRLKIVALFFLCVASNARAQKGGGIKHWSGILCVKSTHRALVIRNEIWTATAQQQTKKNCTREEQKNGIEWTHRATE